MTTEFILSSCYVTNTMEFFKYKFSNDKPQNTVLNGAEIKPIYLNSIRYTAIKSAIYNS